MRRIFDVMMTLLLRHVSAEKIAAFNTFNWYLYAPESVVSRVFELGALWNAFRAVIVIVAG